jgi:hypothetical protein
MLKYMLGTVMCVMMFVGCTSIDCRDACYAECSFCGEHPDLCRACAECADSCDGEAE